MCEYANYQFSKAYRTHNIIVLVSTRDVKFLEGPPQRTLLPKSWDTLRRACLSKF